MKRLSMHKDEDLIRCNCTLGKILDSCDIVNVSVADKNKPYDFEVQFAHDSRVHRVEKLYLLCRKSSPLLGLIDKDPNVTFTASGEENLPEHPVSGEGSSPVTVSGEGRARVITDEEVVKKAASMIMKKHQSAHFTAPDDNKNQDMATVSIEVSKVVGKRAS